MFYNAKNGKLSFGSTDMDYIAFGNGKKVLVMIPGLGDGLTTVKGLAIPFSLLYRKFAKKFRVYVFSRKNKLDVGYTTKDMARDLMKAMRKLHIKKADIVGISQGGMIAQHFAIDYPEMVHRLVLGVTSSKLNPTLDRVISYWIRLAEESDYKAIMMDTAKNMYVHYNEIGTRVMVNVMEKLKAPKSYDRFIIMAKACLEHNAYEQLNNIHIPTLIIGGAKDHVLEGKSSIDIADQIKRSKLVMFEGYGHGVYEESKEFNDVILNFLK